MTALQAPDGSRLSVPRHVSEPPGELTPDLLTTLLAVGDLLVPAVDQNPAASAAPGYDLWLRRSIAARAEEFDLLVQTLDGLAPADAGLETRLRALHASGSEEDGRFHLVSSIVVGAYLMVPEVKELIGYPGQHRDPARVEEAADELSDGLLDPVISRGPIYVRPEG